MNGFPGLSFFRHLHELYYYRNPGVGKIALWMSVFLLDMTLFFVAAFTDHYYSAIMGLADDLYLLKDGTAYKVSDEEDLIRLGYLPGKK